MNARMVARWERLVALLEPVHTQAVATARRLCRSTAEGDDLYQEAVLRAFEKLHTLRDETRFRSWFYAALLSRHQTRLRRLFWRRFLPWEDAFPDGAEPAGEDGNHWDERTQQTARITRALATLAAEQREAVVLFELEGFSIEEIASLQRASIPAVKSRLTRGREKLRGWYERQGFAPARAREPQDRSSDESVEGIATFPGLATASVTGKERSDD